MTIYVTADIHGDPFGRFNTKNFYEQKEFSENKEENVVLQCGDFGIVWNRYGETKEEKYTLDWLEQKNFTLAFVDGNHENHIRLNQYPVKEWNGGKVHEIRPHVLHLMRGEVYTIEGKKFFCFGGSSSHDIQDGILDENDFDDHDDFIKTWRKWDKQGRMFRVNHVSWWKEELPSEEEMQNGINNLEKHNWEVDYIITHSPYTSLLKQMDGGSGLYKNDILTDYLQEIKQKTNYKHWLFGHMHINKTFYWERATCIYEQIIRVL